jgi:hypothetical protein
MLMDWALCKNCEFVTDHDCEDCDIEGGCHFGEPFEEEDE